MKKRGCCLLLAVVMLLSTATDVFAAEGTLSNFNKKYYYNEGRFTDVSSSDWYAENVKSAFQYGLVNGVSDTRYAPMKNVTIAETITIACRINSIYYGRNIDLEVESGQAWYGPYINYALNYGIVSGGDYTEYDVAASRQQFVYLMAKSLPASAFPAINSIADDSIPDMKSSNYYGPSVYLLYNAGILGGNDKYGTFKPHRNISRAEVAAIISRIADTSLRLKITLAVDPKVVYEYLYDLLKSEGADIDGDFYYVFDYSVEDGTDLVSELRYYREKDSISIVETGYDSDGLSEITMELVIPDNLKSPYDGYYSFYFLYDEVCSALIKIDPSTIEFGESVSFNKYSLDGSYGLSKADNEELASLFLQLMLVKLNEDILKPEGFSLDDIGFSAFKYGWY